jgi:uncharacterized protein (DUF169 family)
MNPSSRDYSVLKRFNLQRKPVGVKFLSKRPEGIARLTKELSMCEMLKEAQNSEPFYVTKGDFHCVEPMFLGFVDPEPVLVSGLLGGRDKLFREDRACRAMYNYLPYMKKGSVHSVAFSQADKLPFDPDVLVIMANVYQAQTLLRSVNYSTGEAIEAKFGPVCSCSWIFNYPVISGRINFLITGLGLGMQELNVFPPGEFIISVPWVKIGTMLENLQEMEIEKLIKLTPGPGGTKHLHKVEKLIESLRKETEQ